MKIKIDGSSIRSEVDFHEALVRALDLGDFYGRNLNALWDLLTTDVERPLEIVWLNASKSKRYLGEAQDKIEKLFRDVEEYDKNLKFKECFHFKLVN